MPDILIPGSSSGGGDDFGGFQFPDSVTGSVSRNEHHAMPIDDDEAFFPNVGFNFDAEGNLIDELEPATVRDPGEAQPSARVRSDSMASERVRQEHSEGRMAGQQVVRKILNFTFFSNIM